jgi:hypothetical protein
MSLPDVFEIDTRHDALMADQGGAAPQAWPGSRYVRKHVDTIAP